MATVRLVPSILYNAAGSSYLTISNEANAYTNTDSTTYATIHNTYANTNSRYIYLRGFNWDAVPNDAVVNSFSIKLKANESGGTPSSSYSPVICKGTATYSKAYCDAITTSVTTHTFSVTQAFDTFRDDGPNSAFESTVAEVQETPLQLFIFTALKSKSIIRSRIREWSRPA